LGGSRLKGKFPHKDFTFILMGTGIYLKKKSLVPGFSSKKKENPGTWDFPTKKNSWVPGFTEKIFRALRARSKH
jgi:hypothetical protein